MAGMCEEEREYHRLVAEREKRKSRVARLGTSSRIRSSVAYNQYEARQERQAKKRRWKYRIPKAAALDLSQYPLLVKLDFAGVFLGTIGLVLPYWCAVRGEQESTFGLWSYCEYGVNHCVSVHDNIIPGKDVPVWYFMCQYNFAIGVFMNLVTLTLLTSNTQPIKGVRMSPTVHMAAECFSAIAALEKLVCIYVFVSYITEADFLYTWGSELEYHAAFYCAVASLCFDLITAVILFLEEEIGPRPVPRVRTQPYAEKIGQEEPGVYHHPDDPTAQTGSNPCGASIQDGAKLHSASELIAQSRHAPHHQLPLYAQNKCVDYGNNKQWTPDGYGKQRLQGYSNVAFAGDIDSRGRGDTGHVTPPLSGRTGRYGSFPFEAYLLDDDSNDESDLFPPIPEESEE